MTQVTPDILRDLSVSVVEGFLNKKVPLSEGLAKQASAANLNTEQIKRAVEATNTIAYLKILGMSEDRTVEFPLCKFAEVMTIITVPEDIEKKASDLQDIGSATPMVMAAKPALPPAHIEPMFNSATLVDPADKEREDRARMAQFVKVAAANDRILEDLNGRKVVVAKELQKLAKVIGSDAQWMDKLAYVTDDEEFTRLSTLVNGTPLVRRDLGDNCMFKEASMKDVKSLSELYKEARRLVTETAHREGLQKRAHAVQEDQMVKQASIIGTLGKVIGSGVGKAMTGTVKTVVGTPVKMVGKSLNNTFGPAVSKMTGRPFNPSKGITAGTALGAAASVGFDSAMYHPGQNKQTGRSNDVWDALQRGN